MANKNELEKKISQLNSENKSKALVHRSKNKEKTKNKIIKEK